MLSHNITWLMVLRKKANLNQKNLSALTGISVNRLRSMERMEAPIRPHEAVTLSQVLKVNPKEFVKFPKQSRSK